MSYGVHVCHLGPLDSDRLEPGVRVRCDASVNLGRRSGRCTKMATHGVRYAWGCACYCEKHYREEVRGR